MKLIYLTIVLACFIQCTSSKSDTASEIANIATLLKNQEHDWNNGNVDAYMNGYWKSDSLVFIGSKGLQYGWQTTLQAYKKSYPDKPTMGQLKFSEIKISILGNSAAHAIGKWEVKRDSGNIGGYFTLLLKKINQKWVIVADHTS